MAAPRRYIVLTRAQAQSESVAEILRGEGIDSLICPILKFKINMLKLDGASSCQAVLLTSARAVEALNALDVMTDIADKPCFCVGSETAQAARAAGFENVHIGVGGAAALDALVKASLRPEGGSLLYPCGEDVAYPLAQSLAQTGFDVMQRAVYTMEPVSALPENLLTALQRQEVASVAFYSARTACVFSGLVQDHGGLEDLFQSIKVLCIGPSVLECVQALPWASTVMAESPGRQGMIDLITKSMKQ